MRLPEEFCERMRTQLGTEYEELVRSYESEPYRALRFNANKQRMDGKYASEYSDKLRDMLGLKERVEWEPCGYYYDTDAQPGKSPYHAAGVYYIQEPSAMLPVTLLNVSPGERVLDLCAAPGGKSTQIAGYLKREGILVANEYVPSRAKILSENIERMGVANAIVCNETPERLAERFGGYFDKVLVDAPCSGEGMFRRSDIAVEEWSEENVSLCVTRQLDILNEASKLVRSGGRLVYSTCTFEQAENEENVETFLREHNEFRLLTSRMLMPHRDKGEGQYAAVLVKGEETGSERVYISGSDTREVRFGDNIYEVPAYFPNVDGLKVLRYGLHKGIEKKSRIEPAHALALAFNPNCAERVCDLSIGDARVKAYLSGQTFSVTDADIRGEGEGWTLICVDGYSLGWGKLTNGVMKNHYPKGLRIHYV